MDKAKAKAAGRGKRHKRVRGKVFGDGRRPRLVVYRSNSGIYAQIVDDTSGRTLASASTIDKDLRSKLKNQGNCSAAEKVGALTAERAKAAGIKSVVFDRGGFLYHGRVKALADGARAAGLEF